AQVPPRRRVRQADERAAEAGAVQVVDARHRRPVIDLVLASDPPAEIDAPGASLARVKSQRLERDADLGGPLALADLRRDGTHGIPTRIDVASLVGNLRI